MAGNEGHSVSIVNYIESECSLWAWWCGCGLELYWEGESGTRAVLIGRDSSSAMIDQHMHHTRTLYQLIVPLPPHDGRLQQPK